MTREEALKILKYRSGWNLSIRDVNALEMAIKALEPCEDVISREEAQTAIEMSASRYTLAKEHDCMGQVEWSDQLIKVSDTVDIIRNLPSVKPLEQQPKIGHWIYERCDMYSCSVCHHWHTDLDEKMNYCPNCGAKMVEPQESED